MKIKLFATILLTVFCVAGISKAAFATKNTDSSLIQTQCAGDKKSDDDKKDEKK